MNSWEPALWNWLKNFLIKRALEISKKKPRILAIAGSDSGGGAGIQADLKTITALGGFGMSAITALTAQNTFAVTGVFPSPAEFTARQIKAVIEDIGVDSVKTGMLPDASTVGVVAGAIRRYNLKKTVVDPVMTSKSGARLMGPDTESELRRELLPLTEIVTPNIPEAETLSGITINGREAMREAARRIADMGPAWTVIKGGHIKEGPPVNLVYDGRSFTEFVYERIDNTDTHGTGCTFASAIATFRGFDFDVLESVEKAGEVVHCAIKHPLKLGRGAGPIDHSVISRLQGN